MTALRKIAIMISFNPDNRSQEPIRKYGNLIL